MSSNEKVLLAEKLKGQRLVIPDMRQIFAHWPSGRNENYKATKQIIDGELASRDMKEEDRKTILAVDPALLAATWYPRAPPKQYRILTDFVLWFMYWDDQSEKLSHDPAAAESLRTSTKALIRECMGLLGDQQHTPISDPLILSFRDVADKVCAVYDEEQRTTFVGNFEQYIDSTRLEGENERSEKLPTLDRYWEVRTLTSGMYALLSFAEFAAQVTLPSEIVKTSAYESLWVTTIVINSIVNDLISFKKEMKAGSVLSSVAILFSTLHDLDAAVAESVDRLRRLVDEFDRTADALLATASLGAADRDAVARVLDVMRMMNTGNLGWSLEAPRYGVAPHTKDDGHIELVL
ncbi:terpenoid synthase [Xylariaceae sp. FL0662B]|nr:terpenoid synthase [Xylariaceae sp. FL0662B]